MKNAKEYIELLQSNVKTYPDWLPSKSYPEFLWCEIKIPLDFEDFKGFENLYFGGFMIEKVESCLGCNTVIFYTSVNPKLFISEI